MKKPEAQHRFLSHLLSRKEEKGFTLVELIVVVVIIGILSAIAVPSFNNASDKAKQKEVSVLLNAYIKAVQAHYIEYGWKPRDSGPLGNYVSILGCTSTLEVVDPQICKSRPPVNLQTTPSTGWISTNGLYQIEISSTDESGSGPGQFGWSVHLQATPLSPTGYGAAACFNSRNGVMRVVEETKKGSRPSAICR